MIDIISSLDTRVLESLYTHRDFYTTNFLLGVSEMGGAILICSLAVCISIFLASQKRYAYLAGFVVSSLGGVGSMYTLKHLIQRARPPVAYQAYIESGFSLPSGHATIATAFYGFCIYLIWHLVPPSTFRTFLTLGLGALIMSIAFSRLYLGVHYLSDVIAGLFLGGIFVWLGITIFRKLENRG